MSAPDGPAGPGALRADSGGTPFTGRTLTPSPFAGDDGSVDPALAAALAGDAGRDAVTDAPVDTAGDATAGPPGGASAGAAGDVPAGSAGAAPAAGLDVAAVHAALMDARVFVPVLAVAGDVDADTGADLGADMALPVLKAPDGRETMPMFSSVEALVAWDAGARPVPSLARRVALVAVQEGRQLLVLDVAGPTTVVLPRPALWALAKGLPWVPSPRDPLVAEAVVAAASSVPGVLAAAAAPGRRGELRVVLTVARDLDRSRLKVVTDGVAAALAASEVVAERVDSMEMELVPARRSGPAG